MLSMQVPKIIHFHFFLWMEFIEAEDSTGTEQEKVGMMMMIKIRPNSTRTRKHEVTAKIREEMYKIFVSGMPISFHERFSVLSGVPFLYFSTFSMPVQPTQITCIIAPPKEEMTNELTSLKDSYLSAAVAKSLQGLSRTCRSLGF